jgi:hypothetical protein
MDLIETADRLGDRANGHPEHAAEVVRELGNMLAAEPEAAVLAAIIRNLGHVWRPEACLAVLPYAAHTDRQVRLAVAQAAPGGVADDRGVAENVADVLISLSEDSDVDVRNWATFGLGTTLDVDGHDVRSALVARLDDASLEVVDEALVGLARRRDHRVLDPVRRRLDDPSVSALVFEAATYLADATLLPALSAWGHELPDDSDIQAAVDACDPDRRQHFVDQCQAFLTETQTLLDAHQPGMVAALWCPRLSTEVLLSTGDINQVRDVPTLLDLSGGDPAIAARRVVAIG